MKKLSLLLFMIGLCSCSSVTVMTDAKIKNREAPSYEKRFNYYWWGLSGEHKINVREVCKNNVTVQVQAVATLSDTILTAITLGIYSPRTARAWCEEKNDI